MERPAHAVRHIASSFKNVDAALGLGRDVGSRCRARLAPDLDPDPDPEESDHANAEQHNLLLQSCGRSGRSDRSRGLFCWPVTEEPSPSGVGMSDVSPILTLPPEVLAQVLNNLGHLDAIAAAGVCTQWLEVTRNLVLASRGHLVLHDQVGDGDQPRHPASITTVHMVNTTDVRRALACVESVQLQGVRAVWLHDQHGATRGPPTLRTEESSRATLDAIFDACPSVTSINFIDVPQTAMLLRLLALDRVPKPRFRTRCVFMERDHNARAALDVIEELGAFFQEAVVVTMRPVVSITAQYPHYWSPTARMALPYQRDARALTLHAAGLQPSALRDIARSARLRVLHLYDAEDLDDETLATVLASVHRLGRLAVHDAPAVSSAGWAAAFQSDCLTGLESLQLSACPHLDDESFASCQPLESLSSVDLDLESSAKLTGAGLQRFFSSIPATELLTLAVPFSPSITESLYRAPGLLPLLRRLRVRVQGSTWHGDARVARRGVEDLKKKLRRTSPQHLQMDISLTFIKIGLAVSNSPDEETDEEQVEQEL